MLNKIIQNAEFGGHKKARAMRAYMSLEEGYFENFTSVAKACLAAW